MIHIKQLLTIQFLHIVNVQYYQKLKEIGIFGDFITGCTETDIKRISVEKFLKEIMKQRVSSFDCLYYVFSNSL